MLQISKESELLKKAIQQCQAALHLLTVTFPLSKDPKLLLGITYNLTSALEYCVEAVLTSEKKERMISKEADFPQKMKIFLKESVHKNKIPLNSLKLITKIQEIQRLHRECPVEFSRKNKVVLCSKNYQMQVLSLSDTKEYIAMTKEFINATSKIVEQ